MTKKRILERLFQKEECEGLFRKYALNKINDLNISRYYTPIGKLLTFRTINPSSPEQIIEELLKERSLLIPKNAVAYTASDFNGNTQNVWKHHDSEREVICSVYGVQFYVLNDF